MRALLVGVVEEGLTGEYADYAAAEQATMALSSIFEAMKLAGLIGQDQREALSAALERCYKAVEKDESYKPDMFKEALTQFAAAIPKP